MTRWFRADLHVHTVLSPCAAVEMTPRNIIRHAQSAGIDIVAITDHNAGDNVTAALRCAMGTDVTVVPGMEVQTREEVHLLTLFEKMRDFAKWCDFVTHHRSTLQNDDQKFGAQFVVDEADELIRIEPNMLLASTDLSVEEVAGQVAGMGVITVGSRQDNELFFAQCQKHNVPLAFGMKGDMDAFPPDFLRKVLMYCKLIFCNETEREAMERVLGHDLGELLQHGSAVAIVTTLGGEGSRYQTKEGSGTVPIYRGVTVVDTTGSGDAYISGFLYGFMQGRAVRECAMLGAVVASFALEQVGCCTGLPDEESLLARFEAFKAQGKGAD